MNALLICFLLVLPFYMLLWLIAAKAKETGDSVEPISVVIPFRNEERNLENLKACIERLKILPKDEVILVNDLSSDGGELLLQDLPEYCILISIPQGNIGSKKEALKLGIENAKNNWILTTDADCEFNSSWLYAWRKEINNGNDLICGPVNIVSSHFSLLYMLTSSEHLALQIFTKASILKNVPMLSNGANLMFNKNTWESIGGYQSHAHLASGDDVLLMRDMIHSSKNISYAYSDNCIVSTKSTTNIHTWLNQRLRWMSKSSHLVGFNVKIHASLIILWIFSFPLGLLYFQYTYLLILIPEFLILRYSAPYKLSYFEYLFWPVFRLFYPPIILALFVIKLFYKPIWKGRPIRAEA
jgi:glycosyltransferase involved in cell wall biosynthesis